MTIIEPNKTKIYLPFIYAGLILSILAVLNIHFYNLNVNLKYRFSVQEKNLRRLELANSDLRDKIFRLTDLKNLSGLISERNFIPSQNPDYFEHKVLANL